MKAVAEKIAGLAQACIRVADLSLFTKYPSPNSFKKDVQDFIGSEGVQGPVKLAGRWGREVEIDFLVERKAKKSLVKTVTTGGTAPTIHPYLTEAFSRWYDLRPQHEQDQMVTVIDDKEHIRREDDLERLKTLSAVVLFPKEKEKLHDILSKAG
jgi:hypothetical protein